MFFKVTSDGHVPLCKVDLDWDVACFMKKHIKNQNQKHYNQVFFKSILHKLTWSTPIFNCDNLFGFFRHKIWVTTKPYSYTNM